MLYKSRLAEHAVLFSWLKARRRARLLAEPMAPEWLPFLERNVHLYSRITDAEQSRLRDIMRVLVAEKNWEGCGGLVMTDEVKVTIAAHAALLLLGIEHDYFARVMSILVYPSGFRSPEGWRRADGIVDMSTGSLGEAWYDGPVVLAWDSVLAGGRDANDGRNVVLHEFAHQLDYLDGMADGTPPLRKESDYARWHDVMTREFERLKAESEHGHPRVLDSYGATNHAEFFAVATEAFFEKSREMYARHAELYAVLSEYYGQDPASHPTSSKVEPGDHPRHVVHKPPQSLPGKRASRPSRRAAKVPLHAAVIAEWPWWVRFWEIHPGVSREQALRPLERLIELSFAGLIAIVLAVAIDLEERWRNYFGIILPSLLTLTLLTLAAWLRIAVGWVDRHGVWGGEGRPPAEPAEEVAAPEG